MNLNEMFYLQCFGDKCCILELAALKRLLRICYVGETLCAMKSKCSHECHSLCGHLKTEAET